MPRVHRPHDPEMMETMTRLGVLIKLHRMQRELTQRELAERAGLSIDRVARYENGSVDPPFSALLLIAKALGVKVSDLLRHEAIEV
jgi:transcriptional regulator with XRE-family HTH domain